jgi:hypothetical protein
MAIQLSSRLQRLFQIMGGEHDGGEAVMLLGREVKSIAIDSDIAAATSGVGAINGSAVSAVEYGDNVIHKTVLTLTNLSVTMTDATTSGCHGSHKVYDFPAGVIQLLGASYNLTTLAGSGGIADGAALVGSLGSATAGTNNATLTTTEADMIASTAGTLTSGAGALASHGSLVATGFDGHTTPVDVFLNLAVPDADSSASDTVTVNGTITLTWVNTGDY